MRVFWGFSFSLFIIDIFRKERKRKNKKEKEKEKRGGVVRIYEVATKILVLFFLFCYVIIVTNEGASNAYWDSQCHATTNVFSCPLLFQEYLIICSHVKKERKLIFSQTKRTFHYLTLIIQLYFLQCPKIWCLILCGYVV